MEPFNLFRFSIIRYVPDVLREEFVNIGVLISDESGVRPHMVCLTSSWDRVLVFDPDADLETLQSLAEDLTLRFAESSDIKSLMNNLRESLSNNLQLSDLKGSAAATMEAFAEDLMSRYVYPRVTRNVYAMQETG